MAKKEFQAESKKLMDMMINSIYTNKEIFLRELISNASDAIDKLYYKSLTDTSVGMNKGDFRILITRDKENRILTVEDNGIGMTKEELEQNLGTIAHSGSLDFKKDNKDENIDIIGQFGVGFYSAFMVADKLTVISKAYGSDEAWQWESSGVDGYEMTPAQKDTVGTQIILHIKPDTDTEKYDNFLDEYGIVAIVKKYSDYVRYPIQMEREKSRQKPEPDPKPEDYKPEWETYTELETLNSMIPIWKKQKSEVTDEEYNSFYKDKFGDYADPARVIVSRTEGTANYNALLFVPSHRPYDFYTKDYEKGLALYASGVLIMEKCADLLPDYFSFVKGIVDSQDLSLNISREMLQKDSQLKLIHNALEKKIKNELHAMLNNDRAKYEEFWKEFGRQIKFGAYSDYGMHAELLRDLLHGVRNTAAGLRYVIYAFATDLKDPAKVIAEPSGLLIGPRGEERVGDVSNVVFTNGAIANGKGEVFIYYASSDTRMHVATTTIDKLVDYVFHTPSDPGRSVECVAQRCELIRRNEEFLKQEAR